MRIRTEEERDDARMEYAEELAEERRARRAQRCQCGADLPGYCPGPRSCPYSDEEMEDAP